jgi:hypothetical protein
MALSLVSVTVGCGDASVAPKSSAAQHPSGPSPLLAELTGGSSVTTFIYNPSNPQMFGLGSGHRIFFDANAVCDPAVSTYGPTEWDQPCEPLQSPIAITAVVSTNEYGRPRIDFSPSLRFVPDAPVVLYIKDWAASSDTSTTIEWCDDSNVCIDEDVESYAFGGKKKTKHDKKGGIVFRPIKHFSGYNVTAGRSETSEMY